MPRKRRQRDRNQCLQRRRYSITKHSTFRAISTDDPSYIHQCFTAAGINYNFPKSSLHPALLKNRNGDNNHVHAYDLIFSHTSIVSSHLLGYGGSLDASAVSHFAASHAITGNERLVLTG